MRNLSALVALFCGVTAIDLLWAASDPSPSDPKAVVVHAATPFGLSEPVKVLRTAKGEPLRGPTLWQWKSSRENNRRDDRNLLLQDQSLFLEFRNSGMTAVRLASFEVWFQSDGQPHADWSWSDLSNAKERQAMLAVLETAVNSAAKEGLYLIINAHNKFNAYHHDYTTAFWEAVAPHFANRSHVLYELVNEIRTGPADYTDDDIRKQVELSRRLRELAPDTFQIVLTPSGTWAPSNPDGTGLDYAAMERLGDRFDQGWKSQGGSCDWERTAIGYHLYFNGKTSDILTRLHRRFPALPTEVSFPYGLSGLVGVKDDDKARSESMDGVPFVHEVCERLGFGWLQWHTETREKWQKNMRYITENAQQRGYVWSDAPINRDETTK